MLRVVRDMWVVVSGYHGPHSATNNLVHLQYSRPLQGHLQESVLVLFHRAVGDVLLQFDTVACHPNLVTVPLLVGLT